MSEGTKYSYGEDVRDWVGAFLKELLVCAEKKSWEREGIDCTWEHENSNRPELVVITQKRFLMSLVKKPGDKEDTVDKKLRNAVNHHLSEFLGILTDNRGDKTQGAPEWRFTLKLWSKIEKQRNIDEFNALWKKCRDAKVKNPQRQQAATVTDSPDSPDNPPTNLPPERGIRDSTRFFGRNQTLEDLHQLLQTRGQVAICSVSGMGGLGKTELAIQYAKKYLHHYPRGIFWLDASGEMDIPTQIVNFTQETFDDFTPNRELPTQSQVRQCWKKWQASSTPGKMLAIFDDLADYDRIKQYLPDLKQVQVIVTTRWNLGSDFAELSLKVLALSDAIELLKSRAGAERIEQQLADAERLCNWMEKLPLGLELVGHFLEQEPNLSVGELLISLQDRGLEHNAMRREADKPWIFTAERGLAAAFDLSWQRLDRPSRRLGCMLSLFAAARIPWQLVEMAEADRCNRFGEEFNRELLQSCRRNLRRLHLLEDEGEGSYRLHQLIRQFFREKLGIVTRESEP